MPAAKYYKKACEQRGSQVFELTSFNLPPGQCLAINKTDFVSDFPAIWDNLNHDDTALEAWFAEQGTFLSQPQLDSGFCVTTPSSSPFQKRTAPTYRQSRMGRTSAAVFRCKDESIILEVKGTGVGTGMIPRDEPYANGLLSIECGIKEYLLYHLLTSLIASENWRLSKIYAIILLPTRVKWGDGTHRSIALVREAVVRDPVSDLPCSQSKDWHTSIDVEMTLRKSGFTSCLERPFRVSRQNELCCVESPIGTHSVNARLFRHLISEEGSFEADVPNIQIAHSPWTPETKVIVDLEHFKFRGSGTPPRPLLNLVRDRPFGYGGTIPKVLLPTAADSSFLRMLADDWRKGTGIPEVTQHLALDANGATSRFKQELIHSYNLSETSSDFSHLKSALSSLVKKWTYNKPSDRC